MAEDGNAQERRKEFEEREDEKKRRNEKRRIGRKGIEKKMKKIGSLKLREDWGENQPAVQVFRGGTQHRKLRRWNHRMN